MPLLTTLLISAAVAAPAPVVPVPGAADRLAIEGIGIGDPEGRVITLMPTARCSSVQGADELAGRWCRIPEQQVFGVTPDSLTASLSGDRVLAVMARISGQRWPRLRVRLLQQLGEPQESFLSAPAPAGTDASPAQEALRWAREGSELLVSPAPGGDLVLTLRPVPGAMP